MSLSDCVRCYDTPCDCGFDGYIAVAPSAVEMRRKLPLLAGEEIERIKARLRAVLDEEVATAKILTGDALRRTEELLRAFGRYT